MKVDEKDRNDRSTLTPTEHPLQASSHHLYPHM